MRPNEIWHDATPDASVEASSVLAENLVAEDVISTVATESVAGAVLQFVALWYPLGESSNLVAA